ncbi:MAG TPA: hypothetical protein VH482_06860 [Thermomicrobiales bacterium]
MNFDGEGADLLAAIMRCRGHDVPGLVDLEDVVAAMLGPNAKVRWRLRRTVREIRCKAAWYLFSWHALATAAPETGAETTAVPAA